MKENVSFEQIRGSLGSLLLLWSRIERAAREEVASAHDGQLPKSAYGIVNRPLFAGGSKVSMDGAYGKK